MEGRIGALITGCSAGQMNGQARFRRADGRTQRRREPTSGHTNGNTADWTDGRTCGVDD